MSTAWPPHAGMPLAEKGVTRRHHADTSNSTLSETPDSVRFRLCGVSGTGTYRDRKGAHGCQGLGGAADGDGGSFSGWSVLELNIGAQHCECNSSH